MAPAGLIHWANTVRLTMAEDHGRQFFKDQIHQQGFLFLDNYLDGILEAGKKQETLIDLVKTPGRKKTLKRTKLPPSTLKQLVMPAFEDTPTSPPQINESVAPVIVHSLDPRPQEREALDVKAQPITISTSSDDASSVPPSSKTTLPVVSTQPNELSVIVEADESLNPVAPAFEDNETGLDLVTTAAVSCLEIDQELQETNVTTSSSMASFHSVALDSPQHEQTNHRENTPTDQEPLPVGNTLHDTEVEVPLREEIEIPPLARKGSMSVFPSLPEPAPLRKSIRVTREPSCGPQIVLGVATPAAPTDKRTSWLKKAREVKALETNSKTSLATTVPPLSSNLKRKSGDLSGGHEIEADDQRKNKAPKSKEGEFNVNNHDSHAPTVTRTLGTSLDVQPELDLRDAAEHHPGDNGIFDVFKKTVQGLGAQVGRTASKSLGGAAVAAALAEAKAAAEAKIAQREQKTDIVSPTDPPSHLINDSTVHNASSHRLSISELVTSKAKKESTQSSTILNRDAPLTGKESVSTTPPHSPPPPRVVPFTFPSGPVFNKPEPIFAPPPVAPSSTKPYPQRSADPVIVPMTRSTSPKQPTLAPTKVSHLTPHSTVESFVDRIFSSQEAEPSWMPSTQDTEYLSPSQSSPRDRYKDMDDDDDSWPIRDPVAGAPQWPFNVISSKDDSMTWKGNELPEPEQVDSGLPASEADEDVKAVESRHASEEIDEELSDHPSDIPRSQSQLSSSSQSSSQGGFFNQATKLVHSVLGTSKKGKHEVKSLQLAAAAAKKQHEESEKKAARLKEMDNRRQLALQRKAEEEKAKAAEEERKRKEASEKRKREREEHTDKRPLKGVIKKDDDTTKKRKIIVDAEKKPELKKPTKTLKPSPSIKSLANPTGNKPNPALVSSTVHNAHSNPVASSSKVPEPKATKTNAGSNKGKATQLVEDDAAQPSQLLQSQMAARAKAQLDAARAQDVPVVPSEAIELPDINSEYSDSDDEDRPRTYNPPSWAQSPELHQALLDQGSINPDDIFGAIRPLRMEEIFRSRNSRFRARTSSANWTGTDRLTVEEEREYARRMGYR
ncbi:hypothetical protein ONZ45_g872 [Pleurotus djamor]|nr:hypothetical protein ONZ45_g872 [Pleurotus djamor]